MASPKLFILSENMRDLSFPLTAQKYTLGRTESTDLTVPDPTVSTRHCSFIKQPDGSYSVVDDGSTNGTSVSAQQVGNEPVQLHNGDILMVGSVEILYDDQREDKTATRVRSTSVINLENTQGGMVHGDNMVNLNQKVNTKSNLNWRSRKRQNLISNIIFAILAVLALGVLVFTIYKVMGGSTN